MRMGFDHNTGHPEQWVGKVARVMIKPYLVADRKPVFGRKYTTH